MTIKTRLKTMMIKKYLKIITQRLTGLAAQEVKKMKEECEVCIVDYKERRDQTLSDIQQLNQMKTNLAAETFSLKTFCAKQSSSLRSSLEALYKDTGKWMNLAKEERRTLEAKLEALEVKVQEIHTEGKEQRHLTAIDLEKVGLNKKV